MIFIEIRKTTLVATSSECNFYDKSNQKIKFIIFSFAKVNIYSNNIQRGQTDSYRNSWSSFLWHSTTSRIPGENAPLLYTEGYPVFHQVRSFDPERSCRLHDRPATVCSGINQVSGKQIAGGSL